MKIISLIKKKAIIFSAVLVLFLTILNTIVVYYNKQVLKETTEIKIEAERAKQLVSEMWNQVVRNMDIGVRGFALTKDDALLVPFNDANRDRPIIIKELREITTKQAFPEKTSIDSIEVAVGGFVEASIEMVDLIKMDSMDLFKRALKKDPGRAAWLVFSRNSAIINTFEDSIITKAILDYEKANELLTIIQTLLIILGAPTLVFMIFRISKDEKSRLSLFLKLEKNNRQYIFDPGTPLEIKSEDEVIDNSIKNFVKATAFITSVSSGDFNVQWDGYDQSNERLNKKNLAGELIQMKDKMKAIKAEDETRSWISEGLASFSEVIRQNLEMEELSHQIISFISKYMNAQQGALFILRENDEESFLQMTACYAFNKKKFLEKRLELGEGLVGQTFLEGKSNILFKLPDGYTEITSGLGERTPTCLLLIPMTYNEKVEGVIEIASFEKYEKYQIQFLEKIGEITASTLAAVKNTEKVQILLEQFKVQTEQLKAQEEELRQNMEEMEATQEDLRRQEKARESKETSGSAKA